MGERTLPAGREIVLANIAGNALEILAEIDPGDANEICLTVLRSPGKEEYTDIRFRRNGYVTADASGRHGHARRHPDRSLARVPAPRRSAPSPGSRAVRVAQGEPLKLRIFVDRSIVEVFAGGRQCVALRVYPQRNDSLGVSIAAQNGDASLRRLDAWQMRSIYAAAND